jgi:CHAD domain-containing protein
LIKFRDAQIAAADGTDEQLHTLRISAKRLRYTIELFDSYGVNVTGCEMRDEAEGWQDTLGHLQDLVVVMERSQRVAAKSKWTKAERLALLQVTHLATQEYFNRRHTLSLPSYVN